MAILNCQGIGAATCDARCVSLPWPTAVNRITPDRHPVDPRSPVPGRAVDRRNATDGGLFVRQRLSSEPDRYRGRRRVPTPPRSRYAAVGLSAFVGAGLVAIGVPGNLPDAKAVSPTVLKDLQNAASS